MTGTQTNWLRDGAAEDELRYDDDDGPADDDQEVASAAKGVTAAASPHRSRQSSRGDKVEALKHQRGLTVAPPASIQIWRAQRVRRCRCESKHHERAQSHVQQ